MSQPNKYSDVRQVQHVAVRSQLVYFLSSKTQLERSSYLYILPILHSPSPPLHKSSIITLAWAPTFGGHASHAPKGLEVVSGVGLWTDEHRTLRQVATGKSWGLNMQLLYPHSYLPSSSFDLITVYCFAAPRLWVGACAELPSALRSPSFLSIVDRS